MSSRLTLRKASVSDASELAALNNQLVEDQGSRNPFTLSEYEDRFRAWMTTGEWTPSFFDQDDRVVGYSVHRVGPDVYYPDADVVALRQFFVCRDVRRRGVGRAAFELFESKIAKGRQINIDVLATNPTGQGFWKSLGFETYCTSMTWRRQGVG